MIAKVSDYIHRRFIWFLLLAYVLSGVCPGVGLWMRGVSFGQLNVLGQQSRISLPMAMLAFLLFNAGLGVELSNLKDSVRNLKLIVCGLAANLFVPLAFIFAISLTMAHWHNLDETQNILVGLALVAAMPIAGSSTAWSQNANGNMTISLVLILATTFLSPLTTPLVLNAVGSLTTGDYSEDLHELAGQGTSIFLAICVILPSLAGIMLRKIMGKERVQAAKPYLKLTNSIILLGLIYSNAAISLPAAIESHDTDFLVVMLMIAAALCAVAFFAGWWISRMMHADRGQLAAMMFGLGMNNNGTGLVLASVELADHPRVMLPIIMYNLIQHLAAGVVDHGLSKRSAE